MQFQDKRITVMGLGVHGGGLGVARFLAQQGARVLVTDLKSQQDLAPSVAALRPYPNVELVLGRHRDEDFTAADLVVRNPGVPLESPYLRLAQDRGVPVYMEMTLFFQECPSRRIAGITGTKGKTTTTVLLGEMVRAARRPTVVAGNLRVSALEMLPQITPETYVVLELSSWQLEGLPVIRRSPHAAAITNVYPDHLNRYRGMDEYIAAKTHIFKFQAPDDVLALNRANAVTRSLAREAQSHVTWFDAEDDLPGLAHARLKGGHNRENMAAAAALARALAVPEDAIEQAITTFGGVRYRQEVIRELQGVVYIDDTAATTPEATLAALATIERPIVLIAGGADKELDFRGLGGEVVAPESRVRLVLLLEGSATDKLAAACAPKVSGRFDDLGEAVHAARRLAQAGEAVLLSPGCASFGMFANEFERGDRFDAAVRALA